MLNDRSSEREYAITRLRGEWAIAWRDKRTGNRRRYSLGTSDRVTAETKARQFWQRKSLGQSGTIGELVASWLDRHEHLGAASRNRDAWKAAQPYWERLRPSDVSEETCRAYDAWRKRAPRTVGYEIDIIHRALAWAHKNGGITVLPEMWRPPLPDPDVKALTKAQFRQFLTGCGADHVRLFAQVAVATGARSAAILQLQWEQVDMGRRVIQLNRTGRAQTAKRRATVPMNDQLHEALTGAREAAVTDYVIEWAGKPVANIKKAFRAASERSGVRATPHMLRHSAAVWMAEAGRPMAEIAQYLGHRDSRITERVYARFSPDFLAGAAKVLEW